MATVDWQLLLLYACMFNDMGIFNEFLQTSSIHGLSYISNTKRLTRLVWSFIVISGFTVASFLIYQAFRGWEESPISTTIETLPISEITFPKERVQ